MVACQAEVAALGGQLDALVRLGAVADEIAQEPDGAGSALLDLGEDRAEGGQVAVYVG